MGREITEPLEFVEKYQESPIEILDRKKFFNGTIFINNSGVKAVVIDYINAHNVKVKFLNSGFESIFSIANLKLGKFEDRSIFYNIIGKEFISNEGDRIIVLSYINSYNIEVYFPDYNYNTIVRYGDLAQGKIKNPFHLNIYGGFFGVGKYNTIGDYNKIYSAWKGILIRISDHNKYPEYIGVKLVEEWYNYQNFASWYYPRIKDLNPEFVYHIDKDIKQIGKHPKFYGPDTCSIVPEEINYSIMNIYSKSNLPLGVKKMRNKYQAREPRNGNTNNKSLGVFENPMDAFIVYKKQKTDYLIKLANFYYNKNALSKEDYEAIINIDILPFNN